MSELKAGVAKAVITPAVGFGGMYGYAARKDRNRSPRGVLDDLYARALVVDDGATQAALVTIDTGSTDAELSARVRKLVAELTSIRGENVMLSCTHTHAAVAITGSRPYPFDEHFREDVIRKAAGVVYQAWLNRKPAQFGAGYGMVPTYISEEAYARREQDPFSWGYGARRSDAIMANKVFRGEPLFPLSDINKDTEYGKTPVDAGVGVVRIDHIDGRPMGMLYNFGCHPDVLGPNNVLLSGDFPGYASTIIERELGDGVVAHFCQGAGADIRMVLTCTRTQWTQAETDQDRAVHDDLKRMGDVLAYEALKVWTTLETLSTARVAVGSEMVMAPWWKLPTIPELESARALHEQELARALAGEAITLYPSQATNYDFNIASMRLRWAKNTLAKMRSGEIDARGLPLEIQVIQIGATVIIGIPEEVFALTSLKLKQALAGRTVIVCAHANGTYGYLLPRGCHEEGGYWFETSPKWYEVPCYPAPEAEEMVREAAVRLAKS
jgi:neutral ceramidase